MSLETENKILKEALQRSGVDGLSLIKTIGDLIDSAVPEGNGESIVPTELVEDLREVVFGVRGAIDE